MIRYENYGYEAGDVVGLPEDIKHGCELELLDPRDPKVREEISIYSWPPIMEGDEIPVRCVKAPRTDDEYQPSFTMGKACNESSRYVKEKLYQIIRKKETKVQGGYYD